VNGNRHFPSLALNFLMNATFDSMSSGSRHHDIVYPWVADAGDGLHIYRIAADIVNNQSQMPVFGWGAKTSTP